MDGGAGNDRILFGYGDGQDVLKSSDSSYAYTDTLVFGEGITLSELSLVKVGYDLIIQLSGSEDQITMYRWFYNTYYRVDQIEMSDGTLYTHAEFENALPLTQ